jgi:putative SOS response-associated peptidase YedK
MCYDISFTVDVRQLSDYFPDLIFDGQLHMEFGVVDHVQGVGVFGKHPVIYVNREDMQLHCKLMEWGCIPFYSKEEPDWKVRNKMLNIRSERVLKDKGSYWYKIRNRRCLFPVTAIYEHQKVEGQTKKVPYYVKPKDQDVFFIPGLFSVAEIVDKTTGELVKRTTFGMMTTEANDLMKWIHNDGENKWRMPLFLPFALAKEYIGEDLSKNEERYQEILDYKIPSEDLYCHTTDTIRTAKLRGDGKRKHEPFAWKNVAEFNGTL